MMCLGMIKLSGFMVFESMITRIEIFTSALWICEDIVQRYLIIWSRKRSANGGCLGSERRRRTW